MFKTCPKCNTEKPITDFRPIVQGKYRNTYCRKCDNAVSAAWYRTDKGRATQNRKNKRYYANHRERIADSKRVWLAELWQRILAIYGDSCECCGEAEPQFLSVDHVRGDGKRHRADPRKFHRWLASQPKQEGFRILCFNCNLGRARDRDNGLCPHELRRMSDGAGNPSQSSTG